MTDKQWSWRSSNRALINSYLLSIPILNSSFSIHGVSHTIWHSSVLQANLSSQLYSPVYAQK